MKTGLITLFLVYISVCSWATESFWTAYFEAENFTSQTGGSKASTEYFPYIGDGYLEMGAQGATVTWNNITVPKAGKYTLIFKYANNTNEDLPCDLKVNGIPIKNISFGPFPKNWEVIRPEATEYNAETVGWAKYWNARVNVDLNAGANTLELIVRSEEGGPHIDNIGVSTAVPEPPAPVINVKDHGAVADGSTDNTQAIASAIAACPAGGSVIFDEGIYMTGSITLKANMTLWISENAVLRNFKGNDKIQTYPDGSFQGGYITRYFMFGNQVDNLTITGGGTIDLNTTERLPGRANTRRPSILGWVNSENVTVSNIDLINCDFWAFVPQKSDHVIIDGINLFNINKDGIAPIDCNDVSITNCVISSGDDAMVPKSYDPSRGLDKLVVKNLTINFTRWKGFKFGGSTKGDFTNSIIEDVAMVHTHSGLALYAMSACNVTNIRFNRIKMNNVQTPFFIIRDAAESTSTPGMQDIYISNIEARNVYGQEGSSIQGTERDGKVYPLRNIYLSNVSVKDFRGGLDTVPETPQEFPGRYPETTVFGTFPAWGYYIRHAENVVFTNVTHDVSPEDAREAIVLEDVSGFENLGPVIPSESTSELTFDSSGRSATLVLGGKNMLEFDSSTGFHLRYSRDGDVTDTHLSKISTSGNIIKVSHPDGKPEFTFQILAYDNHLAIHLLDAQDIGTGRNYSLSLVLGSNDVAAYTLNDLMTTNAGNQGRNSTELNWPYLWGRPRPNGTHGSVVLYDDRLSGSARDSVLAEIWSAQGTAGHMVRPAGQVTWTKADVLSWVDQWVAKFSKLATVSVDADNMDELYEMTDKYVLPSGVNRIYMFSTVWRGEYKLNHKSNAGVNTELFPKGKADLIAYSEYLAKHDAHLQLKSLVPQLGLNDERYFSPTYVEPRLLSWGSGTLAEDIDPSTTTIRFRRSPGHMWEVTEKFTKYMRIGNEMIKVGEIRATDDDVWTLSACNRGHAGSTAKFHSAGTEMAGAVTSFDFFHFADDFGASNSLAEEVCDEYGDFLNEVNVGHLHFDGTLRMPECPWYLRDYSDYLYSRVDQPVTGSIVGGSVPANFEKQFSKGRAISGATAYHLLRIAPRLHERGRIHTELSPSILDLHFDVSDGVRIGSRRPTFCGGQSGKILSMEIMDNYGLADDAFQLFKYWVELAPVFDDADADYVAGFLQKRGNHYKGEDVLVLSKNEDGDFIYTPHRVMGRSSGEDPFIDIDQEWGAVPRFQDIKAGTTMELLNPYKQQEPQVVIRVEHGSKSLKNPLIKVNGKGELAVKGEIQANEYMKFEGGNSVNVYDNNWNLLRSLPAIAKSFTVKKGNNTVTTMVGRGNDTPDLRVQFITRGPVYKLVSNK